MDKPEHKPSSQSSDASSKLLDDTHTKPVDNLDGKICKVQPKENEIPTLTTGKKSNGCDYSDLGGQRPADGQMPPFNTAELYSKATPSAVRLESEMKEGRSSGHAQGSGVIMGKGEQECLVATVNHNVSSDRSAKISNTEVVMPNGQTYKAEVRMADAKTDRAVVAVKTGADTDKVCKPAQFAEEPNYKGQGLTVGFPHTTKTLYASPTEFKGIQRVPNEPGGPTRLQDVRNHTKGGNSGGPMYNNQGEVVSLLESGEGTRNASGAPISATDVRGWNAKYLKN